MCDDREPRGRSAYGGWWTDLVVVIAMTALFTITLIALRK